MAETTSRPLVSVIIPAYNCERHVIDTLESIERQTLQDTEVIVVDDGSRDATLALVEEYAQTHPRVQVLHQENAGVSAARNAGLAVARGTYLSFVDAEDTVPPEALGLLAQALETSDATLSIGVIREFSPILSHEFERTVALSRQKQIDRYDIDLIWSFSVNNKLFVRAEVERLGLRFGAGRVAEDGLFLMQYVYGCQGIVGVPAVVLEYRRDFFWDNISATHRTDKTMLHDLIENHELIIEMAERSIEADLRMCTDEARRRTLETLRHVYIQELHYRLVFFLIEMQYRRIWLLDDESVAVLHDAIRKHRRLMSQARWQQLCDDFADLRLSEGLFDRVGFACHPEVTLALAVDASTPASTVAELLESVYRNAMPAFEVLVPSCAVPCVPVFYQQMPNLRIVNTDDDVASIMQAELAAARAPSLAFLHDAVFYGQWTLLDLWKALQRHDVDFVAGQIVQIEGDHTVLWTSQKTVFTYQRSKDESVPSTFNRYDLSVNNKLARTRALRERLEGFSSDMGSNATRLYQQLRFRKLPDILLLTRMLEQEFLGHDALKGSVETAAAYAFDRMDPEHLSKVALALKRRLVRRR